MSRLILASESAARRAMLHAASVTHEAMRSGVDEEAAKATLAHLSPRDRADALAELKALRISLRFPGALVIGSDQILETDDGGSLDKCDTLEAAAGVLAGLSGKRHHLHSAAVIAEGGRAVWRSIERATLHMRPLSKPFIADYLAAEWPTVSGCVGCYRIEGRGAQLFSRIEGSHFAILGLPLLALLDYLRTRGILPS